MEPNKVTTTRRNFLKKAGVATAAAGFSVNLAMGKSSRFEMNSETLKVGLVGCGGRGSGAANQALNADPNVVLWAVADIFPDRMESSLKNLGEAHPEKIKVDEGRKFLGFDAYKKLLESGVDVVLLATPPAFRPDHLRACIDADKHVFCEKPMAVDAAGVRKIVKAVDQAEQKGLSLMGGFCWRYHIPKRETFSRVLDGQIGDVKAIYNTYNTGYLWEKPRQPEWGEMENKLRNWVYYNWLSGDHIAEQAIHSLDMMSWALGDMTPKQVSGTGGRQRRVEDRYGNVFDHFALVYEYENGAKGFHFSRQQKDTDRAYHVEMQGTKGHAVADCIRRKHEITGTDTWKYRGESNNMYQTEHDELFTAIRKGEPILDKYIANSTMLAIIGRMVAYTGKTITWEQAMKSEEVLGPNINQYDWKFDWPSAPVAKPGLTEFR